MSVARVSLGRSAPRLFKIVSQLDQETAAHAKEAGWDEGFLHLLKLRASQINGCAFCVQMHTADAVKRGESTDRIALLSA